VSGPAVDRARVALFATCHAVDDMYQGAVPALLPFFVADRHYSYAAAAGLMFALTAMSSVIQPVFGALTTGSISSGWCRSASRSPGLASGYRD